MALVPVNELLAQCARVFLEGFSFFLIKGTEEAGIPSLLHALTEVMISGPIVTTLRPGKESQYMSGKQP